MLMDHRQQLPGPTGTHEVGVLLIDVSEVLKRLHRSIRKGDCRTIGPR